MKTFLTGSEGFIGKHIKASLEQQGHKVTPFDMAASVLEDITNYSAVYNAMQRCDSISHHAAWVLVEHGLDYPFHENMVNVGGTVNVLQAAYKRGIRNVVVASSMAARYNWWTYGVTKKCVELYSDWFTKYRGLNVACLRYAIVYGRGEWFGRVLTRFVKNALENKPLIVFGSGKQYRDWIHIDDVVRAHNMALENFDLKGIFEVGTGETYTIEQLATLVKEITGSKSEIIYKDVPEGATLEEDQEYWVQDVTKQHLRLPFELDGFKCDKSLFIPSWEPQISLEEGIRKVVEQDCLTWDS